MNSLKIKNSQDNTNKERHEALERVRAIELSNMTLTERKKRYDMEMLNNIALNFK